MDMMVFSDEQRNYIERYIDEKVKSRVEEKNTNVLERLLVVESEIKVLHTEIKAIRNEMKLSLDFMEKRLEGIDKRFSFLQWLIVLGFLAQGALVTIFKFLV